MPDKQLKEEMKKIMKAIDDREALETHPDYYKKQSKVKNNGTSKEELEAKFEILQNEEDIRRTRKVMSATRGIAVAQ